jgi:large repetitive protein
MEQGPALHLRTVSLSRGGQPLSVSGPADVSEDGSLVLAQGAATERLRNAEDGVHQSWEFARRPAGTGALTVRLLAAGAPYMGQTAAGLHFAAPGGLGVRYSEAFWTDASGRSTRLPARYEAGQIVLEVPAAVVESAAYPTVLSPTVSPEFGMDNPVPGPVARIQSFPDVAFDGQNFLVVWQDSRGSATSDVYDIFGARVSAAGDVLDPSGIVISNAVGDQKSPAVAFDGQRYLVVWADSRTGSPRIHGTRVTVGASPTSSRERRLSEESGWMILMATLRPITGCSPS